MAIIHKSKRDDNPDTRIRKAPPIELVRYLAERYAYWIIVPAIGYVIYHYWIAS